jgi:hypothetical protein
MPKKTDLEYRRKWGIPDWRDRKAYPATLPDILWRWEFLRRRADYRADYQQSYATTVKWYRDHSFEDFVSKHLPGPSGDGSIFPSNWENKPESPNFRIQMADSVAKYGLRTMCNPAGARPCDLNLDSPCVFARGTAVLAPMALGLYPDVSMADHIRALKATLKMLQKRSGGRIRKQCTKWANYLRAFDARAEGASFAAIGEILRPDLVYNEAAARAEEYYQAAMIIMKRLIA